MAACLGSLNNRINIAISGRFVVVGRSAAADWRQDGCLVIIAACAGAFPGKFERLSL